MVVILFSSAIVSVTSDKLYLGEARGNSCQSDNKSGGCGKKDSAPRDKRWRKTSERLERRRAGHCWLWRGVWVSQSSAQAEIKLWATCWSRLGEKHNYHSVHVLLPQLSGNQHLMLNKWTKCATKFSLFFSFFFFLSPWILILFIKSQVLGWK